MIYTKVALPYTTPIPVTPQTVTTSFTHNSKYPTKEIYIPQSESSVPCITSYTSLMAYNRYSAAIE